MKLQIEVSNEQLASVLQSAGIAYWCKSYASTLGPVAERAGKDHRYLSAADFAPVTDGYWMVREREGSVTWRLDAQKIARGIQVIADKYTHHLGAIFGSSSADATTGDVLIQCAIFGELRYG